MMLKITIIFHTKDLNALFININFFYTFVLLLIRVPGHTIFPPLRDSHQGPENPLAHKLYLSCLHLKN